MTLRLRRSDSPHRREWERDNFWTVICEGVSVGVVVLAMGRSDEPARWDWHIHLDAGRYGNGLRSLAPLSGSAETRDEALPAFRASWDIIRPAVGEEGWRLHVEHMASCNAQTERWRRQKAGTEPGGYG